MVMSPGDIPRLTGSLRDPDVQWMCDRRPVSATRCDLDAPPSVGRILHLHWGGRKGQIRGWRSPFSKCPRGCSSPRVRPFLTASGLWC